MILTFDVAEQGFIGWLRKALGVLIVFCGLAPGVIVLTQWQAWKPGDPPLPTDPRSLFFSLALMLWGTWVLTRRDTVIIDRAAKSLTWQQWAFGRCWRSVVRTAQQVRCIEEFHRPSRRVAFVVTHEHERLRLKDYDPSDDHDVHTAATWLGLSIEAKHVSARQMP
jgi:hypothetical protein